MVVTPFTKKGRKTLNGGKTDLNEIGVSQMNVGCWISLAHRDQWSGLIDEGPLEKVEGNNLMLRLDLSR